MPLSTVLGAQSLVQPAVCTTATRPASPYTGQAIYDTTISALLIWNGTAWTGTGGLQLVTTTTCSSGGTAVGGVVTIGSAVSSVTVANAFSATYDAYKIIVSGGVGSAANNNFTMRLGASAAGYYYQMVYTQYNSTVQGDGGSNVAQWDDIGGIDTTAISVNMDINNPFLVKNTSFNVACHRTGLAGSTNGIHVSSTSFTGFTLTPSIGTLTGGTVRVYGYQNS